MGKWNLIIYSPAYNVESTIAELVERLDRTARGPLRTKGINLKKYFIVDDGSTDNTWNLLGNMAKKYSWLEPVRKEKNAGPVKALFDAMEKALAYAEENKLNPKETLFVRMDTDLEHQPEDLPKLLSKAKAAGEREKLAVGYIRFDPRHGPFLPWFSRKCGAEESTAFLGKEIPQFCPGFNAMRGELLSILAPELKALAERFSRRFGREMVTLDFGILFLAKRVGAAIMPIELRRIEDARIKKPGLLKLLRYYGLHRDTMEFLKQELK